METKSFNILWNIKIQWISIVVPSKVVLEEFMTLFVKMAQDSTTNKFLAVNYELLCDHVDTIMGFIFRILMLEFVQILNKYAHNGKMFVCGFVNNVKLCQADLHKKYCDEDNKYNCIDFSNLRTSLTTPLILCKVWWNNPTIRVVNAIFFYYGKMYNIHKSFKVISDHIMVTLDNWEKAV